MDLCKLNPVGWNEIAVKKGIDNWLAKNRDLETPLPLTTPSVFKVPLLATEWVKLASGLYKNPDLASILQNPVLSDDQLKVLWDKMLPRSAHLNMTGVVTINKYTYDLTKPLDRVTLIDGHYQVPVPPPPNAEDLSWYLGALIYLLGTKQTVNMLHEVDLAILRRRLALAALGLVKPVPIDDKPVTTSRKRKIHVLSSDDDD
jgi:hypothetical protein